MKNFNTIQLYISFLLILAILRKERGSGKYFSLKKCPTVPKFEKN
jgi:hypothetical protein